MLEHPPVFTLGQAGRRGHVRDPGAIPVVRSDRGGQVTYHGPGQLVAYLLFDLRRAKVGVRRIVETLEQAVIDMLSGASIAAARREDAPGCLRRRPQDRVGRTSRKRRMYVPWGLDQRRSRSLAASIGSIPADSPCCP